MAIRIAHCDVAHTPDMLTPLKSLDGDRVASEISLFSALVHTAKRMKAAAAATLRETQSMGGGDDTLYHGGQAAAEEARRIYAAREERQGGRRGKGGKGRGGKGRGGDGAAEDSPQCDAFVKDVLDAVKWKHVRLRVYSIGEPCAQSPPAKKMGDDVAGKRRLLSVVWIAQLEWDGGANNVEMPVCHELNWDVVLFDLIKANRRQCECAEPKRSRFTAEVPKPPPPRHPALDAASRLRNGQQYVHLLQRCVPFAAASLSKSLASEVGHRFFYDEETGDLDLGAGPWIPKSEIWVQGMKVSDVFCIDAILRTRVTALDTDIPLYPEQMTNASWWLHRLVEPARQGPCEPTAENVSGSLLGTRVLRDEIYQAGLDFTNMIQKGRLIERCHFLIDQQNIDSPGWLWRRPDFIWFWEEWLPRQQTLPVGGGTRIVSGGDVPNVNLSVLLDTDKPVMSCTIPVPLPPIPGSDPLCDQTLPDPIDNTRTIFREETKRYRVAVSQYLAKKVQGGEISREAELHGFYEVQRRGVRHLTQVLRNEEHLCDSTQQLMSLLAKEGWLFGEAEGPRAVTRRVFPIVPGPDFGATCNVLQTLSSLFEILGVCNLHSTGLLILIAVLDSMCPKKAVAVNLLWYGLAATGKSHMIGLAKKLSVPGTMVTTQHNTKHAALGNQPHQYQCTLLWDEIPNGITVQGGAGAAKRANETELAAAESMKLMLTEKEVVANTNTVLDGGKRVTIKLKRKTFVSVLIMSNLGELKRVPLPFTSRFLNIPVPAGYRENHSVQDVTAWGNLDSDPSQQLDMEMAQLYIRQMQCFTAMLGLLMYGDLLLSVETYAFAVVSKRVSDDARRRGQEIETRAADRAKGIATSLMMMRVFHDGFALPSSRWGEGVRTQPRDLLCEDYILEGRMRITETEACLAWEKVMGSFHEDSMYRMGRTLLALIHEDYCYADLFSKIQPAGQRPREGDPPPTVGTADIEVCRFRVGNDAGFERLCSRIASKMYKLNRTKVSSSQVRELFEMLASESGPWQHITHGAMDMDIPAVTEGMEAGDPLFGTASAQLSYRAGRSGGGIDIDTLETARVKWRGEVDPNQHCGSYFPYETVGGAEHRTVTCSILLDAGMRSDEGVVTVSTAFLRRCVDNAGDSASSVHHSAASSNTLTRSVATVIGSDIQTHGVLTADLVPTGKMTSQPKSVIHLSNPFWRGQRMQQMMDTGDGRRPQKPSMRVPPRLPIDTYTAYLQMERICARDPTFEPSVPVLFQYDIDSLRPFVAPELLHVLVTSKKVDVGILGAPLREATRDKVMADTADLLSKEYAILVGENPVLHNGTPHACQQYDRLVAFVSSAVADLVSLKGAGRMREDIVSVPDTVRDVVDTEMVWEVGAEGEASVDDAKMMAAIRRRQAAQCAAQRAAASTYSAAAAFKRSRDGQAILGSRPSFYGDYVNYRSHNLKTYVKVLTTMVKVLKERQAERRVA